MNYLALTHEALRRRQLRWLKKNPNCVTSVDKINARNEKVLEELKNSLPIYLPDLVKKIGIVNLRDKGMSEDEIEIRIWRNLGNIIEPDSFIYSRKGEMRNAVFVRFGYKKSMQKLGIPKSGWKDFDNYLETELKIDKNLNFSPKGEREIYNDDTILLIEVKTFSTYKTSAFLFPSTALDGIKFNNFYKKLNEEFQINKKSGISIANE